MQTRSRCAALPRRARPIRPARPDLPGEEGYRFSHILIREAVYRSFRRPARRPARALRPLAGGPAGRRPRPRRDHRLPLRAGLPMLDRPAAGQGLRPSAAGPVGRATSGRGRPRRARTRRRAGGGQSPRARRQPVRRRPARARLAAARARFRAHPGGDLPEAERVLSEAVREHPRAVSRSTRLTRSSDCCSRVCARHRAGRPRGPPPLSRSVATFSESDDDLGLDRLGACARRCIGSRPLGRRRRSLGARRRARRAGR